MRLGCSAVVNIRRRPAPHSHGAWHIGAWRTIDRRPRTTLGEPSSCKVRHRMYAWDRPCGVQGPRAQHGQDHVRGWAGGAAAGPPANLLAEFTPRRAGLLTYNKPATGFRLALGNWGYHAPRGACGDAAGKARAVGAAAATAAAATAAAYSETAAASTAVAHSSDCCCTATSCSWRACRQRGRCLRPRVFIRVCVRRFSKSDALVGRQDARTLLYTISQDS